MQQTINLDRFRAALIDMDGVLYDSMPGHTLAWKKMMEGVGVECDRDEFFLYEGMTGLATIDLLFRRAFGHGVSEEKARELYAVKSRYFKEMGAPKRMPGADRMLTALRRAGLDRVLVTGSAQSSLLNSLPEDYPGAFAEGKRITAHDVKHGKPDPEPYLMGAGRAGVAPQDCIVVENAPLGVRAGKAAGCFTIAVTTGPIPREAFEKEGADMIFGSMEEFANALESAVAEHEMRQSTVAPDSRVRYVDGIAEALLELFWELKPDRTFVFTDENVKRLVLPDVLGEMSGFPVYAMPAGEENKTLGTAEGLWRWLGEQGATRNSLLVNIGGGVVTDLGGFVASTFKRGIRFVNLPTTVMGAVDAAIGGKTGVDFNGLKNEIGSFADAERILISPRPFATLPDKEKLNGFAEIVKMALLTDAGRFEALLSDNAPFNPRLLPLAMRDAARAKEEVVQRDPREQGLRRILNLGHTAGHAYETLSLRRGCPIGHGEAVAHGLLYALRLSHEREGFPEERIRQYEDKILTRYYAPLPFGTGDREELEEIMTHDKKNRAGEPPRFILLRDIGDPAI